MVSDPRAKTDPPAHAVLAAVFQVRDGRLAVLLWERALDPCAGCWSLPGGELAADETLERSIRRVRRELATAYLGLVPRDAEPALPPDTRWHPVDELPVLAFDHERVLLAARDRLRGKLSYTNIGFALAPATFTISELRDLYRAAIGHEISATNLQRVLLRRGVLKVTGERREPGPAGGRPAAVYRFERREYQITDQFAALRPRRASTPPGARPRRGRA